ncbi:hypothetical protein RhiJN_27567 [Ceratobasidium sp. AG-Ba]|nr:hypothetical protein RhiJN_13511 [Ceratobasidium sp. AG-Ba]QRV99548.1 hypothetical protein RhiJN_27567 [Ceratobasidium sp. AG-Ba]
MSQDKHPALTRSGPSEKRLLLSTSDILEGGQKVYITDEKTGETKWCKTRILAHKEIIDEIRTPEPSNTLCYTIHRPTRGWYIHVHDRSSESSIPLALAPNPLADRDKSDADCELIIQLPLRRTSKGKQRGGERVNGGLKEQDEWSFPPTPPIRSPPRRTANVPGSASTSQTSSPVIQKHTDPLRSPSPPPSSTSISQLAPPPSIPPILTIPMIFAPLPVPVLPQKQPVFSRAYASGFLRVLANTLFNPPRRSFSLSVRAPDASISDSEPIPTPVIESGPGGGGTMVPVLTYTDTTPVLAVSKMTGVLSIDLRTFRSVLEEDTRRVSQDIEHENEGEEDVGLLVATALAYLDFLADRETIPKLLGIYSCSKWRLISSSAPSSLEHSPF